MKMNIYYFGKTLLIIISCYLTQTTAICPSEDVMLPCSCVTYPSLGSSISCGGNQYYNLKNVFEKISGALKEDEKHFDSFDFTNTAINELESNVFNDITFVSIHIQASNLTQINTNAFHLTKSFVKQFSIWHTPYGNTTDNNLFNVLNGMTNIEIIDITNTALTSIPANAFAALNKLSEIVLINNRNLRSIGDNAFYELSYLGELLLTGSPIDHFSDHALSFGQTSRVDGEGLRIIMKDMPNLHSHSFSNVTFTSIQRPFTLSFAYDMAFKFLDENIFGPVLGNGNKISLTYTPLECDCRMFWLYRNRAQFQDNVFNALCTDGKSVFDDRKTYVCDSS